MWSRLTEYAGNVAEIVGPTEQEGGDELWSRLTSIVAPQNGGPRPNADDCGQYADDNEDENDDDEQERYISELERALLLKKKQNEALQARIQELEASATDAPTRGGHDHATTSGTDQEEISTKKKAAEWQEHVEATKREVLQRVEEVAASQTAEAETLVAKVAALEARVKDVGGTCRVLRAKADARALARTDGENFPVRKESTTQASVFPGLVRATLQLSKCVADDNDAMEIGSTEEEVMEQLLVVATKARDELDHSKSAMSRLHSVVVSFLSLQGEAVSEGDVGIAFANNVEAKLGRLSHRLSKGSADTNELQQLREQYQALALKEEKAQRTISALQTQLNGIQARTVQRDVTSEARESEIMEIVKMKDATISKLQASENQLKDTLNHLGTELQAANSEIDELEKVCEEQNSEVARLKVKCDEAVELQRAYKALQHRVHILQEGAQEYEQGYLALLEEAERTKASTEAEKANLVATAEAHALSTDQQRIYELEALLSTCEADKEVANQDVSRLQSELDALNNILFQFRTEHNHQKEKLLELERTVEAAHRSMQRSNTDSASDISSDEFKRVMSILSKKTLECDQLREALENSAKRYTTDSEVLDKRLAAQLMVSYVESDKKHEVLQLISRVMGFSDEQCHRAGICSDGTVIIPGNGGGGLFSSLLGIDPLSKDKAGDTPSTKELNQSTTVSMDGKTFTDVWADFLLDEAQGVKD